MDQDLSHLPWWKRQRYRLEASILRAAVKTVPRLSYWTARHIGGAIGSLGYFFLRDSRRIALANLDIAFGDTLSQKEKRRIARSAFENFGITMVCLFWMPRLNRQNAPELITWDESAFERLHNLRKSGRGILFVGPHYGNWELAGLLIGLQGFPTTTAVQHARNPAVAETINNLRGVTDITIIPQRFAGIKIFKALKRGECSLVLVDLNATRHGGALWADFFGLPVLTNSALAGMAVRTNAAVIPFVGTPLPGGRVRLTLGEEITADAPADEEDAIRQISRKSLAFCEDVIRQDPRFWLWTYKRWKRRPSQEKGRYPFYSKYEPSRLEGVKT